MTDYAPHNMTAPALPVPYAAFAGYYGNNSPPYTNEYPPLYAFHAFDGGSGLLQYWLANNPTGWLCLDIGEGNTTTLFNYTIKVNTVPEPDRAPKNWTVEGSNDLSTWDVLDTVIGETDWASGEERNFICDVSSASYRYFRINVSLNNGNASYLQIAELYLYGALHLPTLILEPGAEYDFTIDETTEIDAYTPGDMDGDETDDTILNSEDGSTAASVTLPCDIYLNYCNVSNLAVTGPYKLYCYPTCTDGGNNNENVVFLGDKILVIPPTYEDKALYKGEDNPNDTIGGNTAVWGKSNPFTPEGECDPAYDTGYVGNCFKFTDWIAGVSYLRIPYCAALHFYKERKFKISFYFYKPGTSTQLLIKRGPSWAGGPEWNLEAEFDNSIKLTLNGTGITYASAWTQSTWHLCELEYDNGTWTLKIDTVEKTPSATPYYQIDDTLELDYFCGGCDSGMYLLIDEINFESIAPSWKDVIGMYVLVGGAWKAVTQRSILVGGAWKQ